jgi:hypothetical protein
VSAALEQLIAVRSQLVEEVLAYLDAVARHAAELPSYYPAHLRPEAGETRFDAIRQAGAGGRRPLGLRALAGRGAGADARGGARG